jgi:hypothetical protein
MGLLEPIEWVSPLSYLKTKEDPTFETGFLRLHKKRPSTIGG